VFGLAIREISLDFAGTSDSRLRSMMLFVVVRAWLMTLSCAAIRHRIQTLWLSVCAALLLQVGGCKSKAPVLEASPNIYVNAQENPYADVPAAFQTNTATVIYATDRQRETTEDGTWLYGPKRSRDTSFGLATVTMGPELSWPELAAESCAAKRKSPVELSLSNTEERGHYPQMPAPIEVDGTWIDPPEYVQGREDAVKKIHELLSAELAKTPRKELFVFVHGYANTFESGCFRSAQIWHFVGRAGVPVLFSWPAGSAGLLRGYNHDRESGEFANPHLKMFLRALSTCPDVQKIHLIAHSRGTDILSSAVRELHIEHRAAGKDTRTAMKFGHIVLAAPDIDLDVFIEKFTSDRVSFVAERVTIYVSPSDQAIGLSDWLFSSAKRIGQLALGDLGHDLAKGLDKHPIINIVDVRAKTDKRGHGYFLSSPACLSDLILVLRDGRKPGAENGRPLIDQPGGFWELRDGYPDGKGHSSLP
jgi:esterase/lipase superfamily enzyme